ncbi:MAG: class I SAM-dependent methyltransferase [Syntrophomonas sp.]
MAESLFKNAVHISRQVISQVVKPGDIVVDATCGRGNDTLLLARLAGEKGRVYAFDIQDAAIETTRFLLQKNEVAGRVELFKTSHAFIDTYIKDKVKAVMFNLGYLPGGNHDIKTEAGSTVEALRKSLELLDVGGLISIVFYLGHPGGQDELEAVRSYLSGLCQQDFEVMENRYLNQINNPPQVILVYKLKENLA